MFGLTVGRACLYLGVAIALLGIGASVYGALAHRREWVDIGRRCVFTLAGLMTVAFVILEVAFITSNFRFAVVGSHSSTTTPLFYRITAMWSSQEGSLLLWVFLLSVYSSLALIATRRKLQEITPWATAVLLTFGGFFLSLDAFMANPFKLANPVPLQGIGLEPLLQHPSMIIHPPMLYSGYTLFTIPFAFAVGALITGRVDAEWTRATRRFGLVAWLCLGTGILLGARWSWTELGWGGYWAWDPVENAALMPWLTGTALLHSIMVQERRGMLKTWTVSLVLSTGILAVLGTFLVRSGLLESIHAFGASTLGTPFLVFIAFLVLGAIGLVTWRHDLLRSTRRPYSALSRESIFLLNNLVLVGLCLVIFWGTFFPIISEVISGHKDAVGPVWFDHYTMPLGIALVLLSGIGPAVAWRRTTPRNAARTFRWPVLIALVLAGVLVVTPGAAASPPSIVLFAVAAFVVATIFQELLRATAIRHRMTGQARVKALPTVIAQNRRRYGGYLVHVGMVVVFVGIAASSAFQHISEVQLQKGQSATIDGYQMRYVKPTATLSPQKATLGAVLDVSKNGKHVTTLSPAMGYYPITNAGLGPVGAFFNGNAESAIGLDAGVRRDIWSSVSPNLGSYQKIINGLDTRFPSAGGSSERVLIELVLGRYVLKPPPATFRFIVSPMVEWIWLGGIIVALGALVALAPSRRPRRPPVRAAVRPGREPAAPPPAREKEAVAG